MATVVVPDHLLQHTAGQRQFELPAANIRELLAKLEERWPGSEAALSRCAVAIDGQIHQDAFLEPLKADSEVFFMQRIEGG